MKDWRDSEWFRAWLELAQHRGDDFPRERERTANFDFARRDGESKRENNAGR